MDPCVAAELRYSQYGEEDLEDLFGPLGLKKAKVVLMPVNDNTDRFKAGKYDV